MKNRWGFRSDLIVITLLAVSLVACNNSSGPAESVFGGPGGWAGGQDPGGGTPSDDDKMVYVSKLIKAAAGGELSLPDGTTLVIPPGSLNADTTITLGKPKEQGTGVAILGYVSLEPSGLALGVPATLEIPVDDAAVENEALLFAYSYSDETPVVAGSSENSRWEHLQILGVAQGVVEVEVVHFSWITAGLREPIYVVMHLPGEHLLEGDLIYALALMDGSPDFDWFPGHAAIYLGTDVATSDLAVNDGETIVESVPGGVYVHDQFTPFRGLGHLYMGARRYEGGLSATDREEIAEYAIDKEGSGYSLIGEGNITESAFSCVGLTEASYDSAGKSIIPAWLEFPFILPIEQFVRTTPVDSITVKAGEALSFPVRGVLLEKVSWDPDKYNEIEASASGLREDLGMGFSGNTFTWLDPVEGTYTVVFESSGVFDGSTYSTSQALELTVTPDDSPPDGILGSLLGSVKDAATSAPLSGVQVTVYFGSQSTGEEATGSDGTYELDLPVGAGYRIVIEKAGYLSENYEDVTVSEGTTTYLETVLQVSEQYSGPGDIEGLITNALTGAGVDGLTIDFRKGVNQKSGTVAKSTTTGEAGYYFVSGLEAGNYTGEISGSGFNTTHFTVVCLGGVTNPDQNAAITPVLSSDETRVVLTWGDEPDDLDSHLTGPTDSGDRFHIFFSEQTHAEGGTTYADLDLDDTDSYGPETTTIYKQIDGLYRYSVHDYSNGSSSSSDALSQSGAQVRVYSGSDLLAKFDVPSNLAGTLWTVFELDGNDLTPVNTMGFEEDSDDIE